MRIFRAVLFILSTLLLTNSCSTKDQNFEGFNFSKFTKLDMPSKLKEISGLCIDDSIIYAIQDEKGSVFELDKDGKILNDWQFEKNGDFEEIIKKGEIFYVLRSDGSIFSTSKSGSSTEITGLPNSEYEAMFKSLDSNKIFVLVKNPKFKFPHYTIPTYSVDLARSSLAENPFFIQLPETKEFKSGLKASGAAQNPISRDIFVVSAIHKKLMVFDKNFKYKSSLDLAPTVFFQPEGISFDSDGNLYISNEGKESAPGNILVFKREM